MGDKRKADEGQNGDLREAFLTSWGHDPSANAGVTDEAISDGRSTEVDFSVVMLKNGVIVRSLSDSFSSLRRHPFIQ